MPQWAINGAQINSALYLVMVFTAGIVTGHRWAWTGAVAAAGLTYLSYASHCARIPPFATMFNVVAIGTAFIAGVVLLW